MGRKLKRKLAVIDFETDPFKYGRVPRPFCVEFYCDEFSQQFWGENCADQLAMFLEALPDKYLIYAHNGGKFDFHFLHKYIDNPALIIKTRIVEAKMFHHTLRDSYAILPVPLRDYEKQEFDYSHMERPVRHRYKKQILEYLHSDCVNLYNLVAAFVGRFGPQMTIGGTAIKEVAKLHPFHKSGSKHDEAFRKYYFGGRVQYFKSGVLPGPWKLYDVNSMYPASMKNKLHPINGLFDMSSRMPKSFKMPYFVTFRGRNHNALPSIAEDGGLIFTVQEGIFHACSHELEIALDHGLVEIDEVIECLISQEAITFDAFVDKFYTEKADCKRDGDKTGELFAKLILNSAYGRTGINPHNFADWTIHRDFGSEEILEAGGYKKECDYDDIELWSKPATIKEEMFCDVAIAASITSGARATLLEGLQASIDPIYCDTDSIICRDFGGDIDKYRLGAWDLEKSFDVAAIGGKKMYACYSEDEREKFRKNHRVDAAFTCDKCKLGFPTSEGKKAHMKDCNVKLSSKGGSLNLAELISISEGATVQYHNDAPTFSLKKPVSFVSRKFKKTTNSLETPETVE